MKFQGSYFSSMASVLHFPIMKLSLHTCNRTHQRKRCQCSTCKLQAIPTIILFQSSSTDLPVWILLLYHYAILFIAFLLPFPHHLPLSLYCHALFHWCSVLCCQASSRLMYPLEQNTTSIPALWVMLCSWGRTLASLWSRVLNTLVFIIRVAVYIYWKYNNVSK